MSIRHLLAVLAAAGMAATHLGFIDATRAHAQEAPRRVQATKPPKAWPADAKTLRDRRLKAEALPLFSSVEPLDITITADLKAVQRDRDIKSKTTYPGTLSITTGGTPGPLIPIQLRTRGHVRRNARTCAFAPLRLDFPKDQMKGTVFQGLGSVKLGTHCQDVEVFRQYTLKEHLASRILNVLTPRSRRSRLAHVTYVDSASGKKPLTRLGLLFENEDDMAKRMEARVEPRQGLLFRNLDQPSVVLMSLFQYMIGNTDYSIMTLHNIVAIVNPAGVLYPVPYDFDFSGLVSAHYAAPAKALGIVSVRDRFYRGPCKPESELEPVLGQFRAKKGEIMALPAAMPGLSDGHRKDAEKYLSEFFDLISRPDKSRRVFVTDCKPLAGM